MPKKTTPKKSADTLRPSYDFSQGTRGKHAAKYAEGVTVEPLPDGTAAVKPKKKKEKVEPPTYWTAKAGDIIETEVYTNGKGEEIKRDVVAVNYKDLHKGDFYMTVAKEPGRFTFSSALKQTENGHEKDHSQIVFIYKPHQEKVKAKAKTT